MTAALNKKPGRPIKPRTVKSIRSEINQPYFSCKKCDDAFDSYSKLRKHKLSEHSNSMNSSGNSMMSIKHSTRNNSFSEEMLLCEDLTLENSATPALQFDDNLEVKTHNSGHSQEFKCEKGENDVSSTDNIMSHDKINHQSSLVKENLTMDVEMKPLLSCDQCDFDCEDSEDLKVHHIKNIHDIQNKNKTKCRHCRRNGKP